MRIIRSSRFKTSGLLVVVAAGALLLASCNVGGAGIFYTLEKSTAQTTSAIGDSRSAASMAGIKGTGLSTPGVYYVGAGTVYTATVSSSPSWQSVTAPAKNSAGNPYICTSLAVDNTTGASTGTLYAVYYDPNADSPVSYLYSATVSNSSANQNPSWSVVSGFGSSASFTVQRVFSVNGYVFAVVMENSPASNAGPYDLYEITSPTTSTSILSGLQDPPSAGAFQTGTTNDTYWFIGGNNSGPQLYSASVATGTNPDTGTFTTMSSQPSLPTGVVYRGIFYSVPLGTLFVSTSTANNVAGRIYALQGGSWSTNSIVVWPSGTTETGLTGFDQYEVNSTTVAILVGADTGGYYEIDLDPTSFSANTASTSPVTMGQPGNTTTNTAGADYVSTTLASSHVIGFFNDQGSGTALAPQRIFALTQNGLWLNETPSGSSQRSWALQ